MCKEVYSQVKFDCGCIEMAWTSLVPHPKDCKSCKIVIKRECMAQITRAFPCPNCAGKRLMEMEKGGAPEQGRNSTGGASKAKRR